MTGCSAAATLAFMEDPGGADIPVMLLRAAAISAAAQEADS
jgi:hypothetical protein